MFNVSRYYRGLPHEFRNSFSPLIRSLEHQKMAHIFEGPPGEIFMPAVKKFFNKIRTFNFHKTLPNMALLAKRLGDLDGRDGVCVAPHNHDGNVRFGEGF